MGFWGVSVAGRQRSNLEQAVKSSAQHTLLSRPSTPGDVIAYCVVAAALSCGRQAAMQAYMCR